MTKRGNYGVWLILAGILIMGMCREKDPNPSIGRTADAPRSDRTDRRIDDELTPASTVAPREGLAAAIVIDVSGSMRDSVDGDGGRREPKIEIARRSARDLVEQFAKYAEENKDHPVELGIYEFSERDGEPDLRAV